MKKSGAGAPSNKNKKGFKPEAASSLIGGIVEKGFCKQPISISEPQVTVLPFPVARHRSHGPHWDPRAANLRTGVDEDEDGGQDEDDSDHIGTGAVPVPRKQKKGLDFTLWRELMNDNTAAECFEKDHFKSQKDSRSTNSEISNKCEQRVANVIAEAGQGKLQNGNQSTVEAKEMTKDGTLEGRKEIMEAQNLSTSFMNSKFTSKFAGLGQGSTSVESEIDAENRQRLEKMSTDEIAEAQAEIMNKMHPMLIKMLQKRGQEKMKKKNSLSSEVDAGGQAVDMLHAKGSTDPSPPIENTIPQKMTTSNMANLKASSHNLWDAWSTNVEAARELRFSLEGDVINEYPQVTHSGDASAQSFYSAQNASERDFLRTEGDPGAFGYNIKEALALTRSVVPGQRALALQLLASLLNRAQAKILQNQFGLTVKIGNSDERVDWEALWAFALGPEPVLALSLRICLDDNHNSVVLACAKVIQCVLSCDLNERFFDISEKLMDYKDVSTAPIFRSRSTIDVGFIHGGFWKYNTKPSNIFPFDKSIVDDETEVEHTIKDDVVVATQDIAAGLVRMGLLPRILYLLESDPYAPLEECLISILIAIARHSPASADAIMKCDRLIETVVHRFTAIDQMEVSSSKIKSVILIKVLARSKKRWCMEFIKNGIFQKITWHLYRNAFSPDHWLNMGMDKCKLSSALLVEQLRFWKVCIQYGYCVSYFADLLPTLYIWLDVPTFGKLIERNILHEFLAITKEVYLVLEALTRTLPNFYSHKQNAEADVSTNNMQTWCWNHVGPMINLALKWISLETDPYLANLLSPSKGTKTAELSSMLWVTSAVMDMLFGVLKQVIPEDDSSSLPWLPEFVPKIGLNIIKNGLFRFPHVKKMGNEDGTDYFGSFLEYLSHIRHQSDKETSLASVCCLHSLVKLVSLVDKLINRAKTEIDIPLADHQTLAREDKILTDGIINCSLFEMTSVLTTFMKHISSQSQLVHSLEMFGRGGPAPGVGVGWGASGGGFWSLNVLLTQMDARLVLLLLEILKVTPAKENPTSEEDGIAIDRLNCILGISLLMGPKDRIIMDKVLDILLQPDILMFLDFVIRRFLDENKRLNFQKFRWQHNEEEYLMCSDILISHFKNRWLHTKKSGEKVKTRDRSQQTSKKGRFYLDTIQEDTETSIATTQDHPSNSLLMEWAHQRLPLPEHWFLSPISTIDNSQVARLSIKPTFPEVARCGLFFLLGLEAMSTHLSLDSLSTVRSVPVIWKLHSLSVALFSGIEILEEEQSRDVYEALQDFYGQILDENVVQVRWDQSVDSLKFDEDVHDSYSTFIDTLVENFAGASYGDVLYGRQVAMYLHRSIGTSVRLAAWNALSNIRALELLPPLERCLAKEGYLEPVETDEMILEAYVKSWVSGALDRSVTRGSVAFTLAIHHLSCFIFGSQTGDQMSLRNILAKSILRDYSRKPEHEGMMVNLIRYKLAEGGDLSPESSEIERRLTILSKVSEGSSSLLSVVEKLKTALR